MTALKFKHKNMIFILLFLGLIGLITFFSTPWKSATAPTYSPLSDIQINVEKNETSFPHELMLTVYNGTNHYFECQKPTLEYQHKGIWYKLKTPFYFLRGTSARAIVLDPEKTTTIYMNTTPYGYFLKNGHYRVVISTTGAESEVIAVTEFDLP